MPAWISLYYSQFNEHCDVARRMFMYPYFDPGWSQRLKWFSKPHDGSDGPASADVYLPIYDARNSASTSPFVPSDCPSGADAPTGQDVPPVHNPMSEVTLPSPPLAGASAPPATMSRPGGGGELSTTGI